LGSIENGIMIAKWTRIGCVALVIILGIAAVLYSYNYTPVSAPRKETPLPQIAAAIRRGEVRQIIVRGNELTVRFKDLRPDAFAQIHTDRTVEELFSGYHVTSEHLITISEGIEYQPSTASAPSDWNIGTLLRYTLPAVFVMVLVFGLMRLTWRISQFRRSRPS
jgi:hypothetical protein